MDSAAKDDRWGVAFIGIGIGEGEGTGWISDGQYRQRFGLPSGPPRRKFQGSRTEAERYAALMRETHPNAVAVGAKYVVLPLSVDGSP